MASQAFIALTLFRFSGHAAAEIRQAKVVALGALLHICRNRKRTKAD